MASDIIETDRGLSIKKKIETNSEKQFNEKQKRTATKDIKKWQQVF